MTKRILSIDGGGIRGILPLALLVEIEERRGPCADLFDMVAGTSIGGIIATGLAHRVSAKTIYNMLVSDGGTIFAKTLVTDVLNAVEPRYDAAPLEGFLAETFDGAMLDGIVKPELIVPTVDLLRPTSIFFKSWRARKDPSYNFALKDVARATSAAETYFAPAVIMNVPGGVYRCVDGGTAINNPTIAAILEAKLMWQGEDIRVLSLGTGTKTEPIEPANGGIVGWLPDLVSLFMDSQTSVLHHLAQWAVPGLVRCDILLGSTVSTDFDDATSSNIAALAALGKQFVTAQINNALTTFAPPPVA
ncbi:MAG: patatin-like phospholipase family protein [Beijerinckiaceae bacterium]